MREIFKISQHIPHVGPRREQTRNLPNPVLERQAAENRPQAVSAEPNVPFRLLLPLAVNLGVVLNTTEMGYFPPTVSIIIANTIAFGAGALIDRGKRE
jgi:hypothetical protein